MMNDMLKYIHLVRQRFHMYFPVLEFRYQYLFSSQLIQKNILHKCNVEGKIYLNSFTGLLLGGSCHRELVVPDEEVADVSLVTGKLRNIGLSKDQPETSTSVVLRTEALGVATIPAHSAGR